MSRLSFSIVVIVLLPADVSSAFAQSNCPYQMRKTNHCCRRAWSTDFEVAPVEHHCGTINQSLESSSEARPRLLNKQGVYSRRV